MRGCGSDELAQDFAIFVGLPYTDHQKLPIKRKNPEPPKDLKEMEIRREG